jgi:hypothetical protein
VTVNGKITITFRCEKAPSEEQHQALIGALEFLFGNRPDFDLTVEGGAPFGYEMDAMMIETGSLRPKQAEAPESAKDLGERAFREAAPNRLGAIKPPGIYIKQELNNDWIGGEERQKWGPHHHEERMPAYPSESLEFSEPTLPEPEE